MFSQQELSLGSTTICADDSVASKSITLATAAIFASFIRPPCLTRYQIAPRPFGHGQMLLVFCQSVSNIFLNFFSRREYRRILHSYECAYGNECRSASRARVAHPAHFFSDC